MRPILALLATAALFAADAKPVTVFMYSEYIDPAIPEQFEKATGMPLQIEVYEAQEDMLAKLQTGGTDQYDVIVASDLIIRQMVALKLVQPLDHKLVPNAANVAPEFLNPAFDPGNAYSFPYLWGTIGILYDTSKVPSGGAASWKWVLDQAAQPGPFVLLDEARSMLACALLGVGKPIGTRKPDEIKAAADALIAAKHSPKCLGFDGGVGGKNKVLAGEAALAVVFNGDAVRAIDEKPTLAYAIPSEGSNIWVDVMLITAKAPNKAGAHAFINYILDGKVGAQNAQFIRYATPNQASLALLKPEDRANPGIYPTAETRKRLQYLEDLGKDTRLYDQAWTTVKTK
jgi:spermidine/putrescine transport system substrate-binding protein